MSSGQAERTILTLSTEPALTAEAGIWLGAIQSVRSSLLLTLERIRAAGWGQEFLDWQGPDGDDNSVGSLLYHIAAVELGWNYFDMHEGAVPEDVKQLMSIDGWTDGRLTHVPGRDLAAHLELLQEARDRLVQVVSAIDEDEWQRLRYPPDEDYAMSPAWTVLHLIEHEAGHTYEIRRMVRKWRSR